MAQRLEPLAVYVEPHSRGHWNSCITDENDVSLRDRLPGWSTAPPIDVGFHSYIEGVVDVVPSRTVIPVLIYAWESRHKPCSIDKRINCIENDSDDIHLLRNTLRRYHQTIAKKIDSATFVASENIPID